MPDELWSEVRDIVQEALIKTISKKKKGKKAKWWFEEAYKQKKRGEKPRRKGKYTPLNAVSETRKET